MEINNLVNPDIALMLAAFDEIQMPRSAFMLENLVIKSKDTDATAYSQCVLELSIAFDNLRISNKRLQILQIEIDELIKNGTEIDRLNADIKQIELEQYERTRLGAKREFECLYSMWSKFPRHYTRKELEDDQQNYWNKRLSRQANQDIQAIGRVTQGNQDALRQIGLGTIPQLDVVRDIERRFTDNCNPPGELSRILIVVPTQEKAINGLACLTGVTMPSTCERKILNVYGREIADAYTYAAMQAVQENVDYMITIEDDTFPQSDAIIKLVELAKQNPGCAIGAWYPMRNQIPVKGVHIILHETGDRDYLSPDSGTHEVYTLAMGCTIYPTEMFVKIPQPWFVTTSLLTQDSFFSQLAREHGYKLLVDTSIKCTHRDRKTLDIYSETGIIPSALQVPYELEHLLEYVKDKKLILEIGTMRGGTLQRFLQVADDNAEVITIDKPNGKYGGEYGQPDIDVMQSWKRNGQQLHIIRDDSQSQYAKEQVETILHGRKLDFVFVDGDHSYQGVKADYDRYRRYTKGIMAFHDIVEHAQTDVGVKRFWEKLEGNKTEIIKDLAQGWGGVGILEVTK